MSVPRGFCVGGGVKRSYSRRLEEGDEGHKEVVEQHTQQVDVTGDFEGFRGPRYLGP